MSASLRHPGCARSHSPALGARAAPRRARAERSTRNQRFPRKNRRMRCFSCSRRVGAVRAPSPDVRLGHPRPRLTACPLRFAILAALAPIARLPGHGQPLVGCAARRLLGRMPSAAPEPGGFQEKIAGCDVFREVSAEPAKRTPAGCRLFPCTKRLHRPRAARQDAERSTSGRSPPSEHRQDAGCFPARSGCIVPVLRGRMPSAAPAGGARQANTGRMPVVPLHEAVASPRCCEAGCRAQHRGRSPPSEHRQDAGCSRELSTAPRCRSRRRW
jgi:hypothetical protein